MKTYINLTLSLLVALQSHSQLSIVDQNNEKRVHFLTSKSWSEIVQIAQMEHKIIFIDFYASWCTPCKKMEQYVFQTEKIAEILNRQFISIRVQVDSTKEDDLNIKQWYNTSHAFVQEFNIVSLPTYVFLSETGKPLHKSIGYQNQDVFEATIKSALDTNQQYYKSVENWHTRTISPLKYIDVAEQAYRASDKELGDSIVSDFLHNYLDTLAEPRKQIQEIFRFIENYAGFLKTTDKIFEFLTNDSEFINQAKKLPEYSHMVIDAVIYHEIMAPYIASADSITRPNWDSLYNDITIRFGESAARQAVFNGKTSWFESHKQWDFYTEALTQQIRSFKRGDSRLVDCHFINSFCWEIFLHSHNKSQLKFALASINKVVPLTPESSITSILDTRANILYKLGNRKKALAEEKKVILLNRQFAAAKKRKEGTLFAGTYEKMLHRIPTWNE